MAEALTGAAEESAAPVPAKKKAGRPSDPNALRFHSLGATDAQRAYLSLFANPQGEYKEWGTYNPTEALQAFFEDAMPFLPLGPASCGTSPRNALGQYRKRTQEEADSLREERRNYGKAQSEA